jgi:ABC-type lipoprotein release transport system permease subunit
MIIVKTLLLLAMESKKFSINKYYHDDIFNFFYNGEKFPLKINDTFKENTNIISNNLIAMNLENAKSILGLEYNEYSKLFVHVPNDSEIDYIAQQIKEKYPFMKVTTKEQVISNIEHLFYYKGGVFMILYVVALISFFILLYKQVSSVSGKTKKEIAILRSIGYSIQNIISLKLYQNLFISISSFIIGVIFAYIFVFIAQAPLLKNIFLGDNLDITFTPVVDLNVLSILFFFSVVPFIAAILIPSWKVAISETSEVIK